MFIWMKNKESTTHTLHKKKEKNKYNDEYKQKDEKE